MWLTVLPPAPPTPITRIVRSPEWRTGWRYLGNRTTATRATSTTSSPAAIRYGQYWVSQSMRSPSLQGTSRQGHGLRIVVGCRPVRGRTNHAATLFDQAALLVQELQEVVRRELDILVPPFGRPVVAGDDPGAVHSPEVAKDERI